MIITINGNIPSRFAHSFNVMKMAQGFVDAGEKVELVSYLSLPLIIEKFKIKNIFNFYGISNNIKTRFIPELNKNFFKFTVGSDNFCYKVAQYIAKQKPNFVYCRSFLTAYHTVKLGIPSIIETHATNFEIPQLQKIYEISNDPNFLGLITIHEKIKKGHINKGISPNKILVLEDGVDIKQYDIADDKNLWRKELNLPVNSKIALYCGSMYKEKGIEDILLTAKKLSDKKEILFVLVGGGDNEVHLWKRYCTENNINNTIFTGFAANSDVPKYLKSADILLMPYNTEISYDVMDIYTTSPLKLFEYMASKRPIVSSDIPVISKIITHNESSMLAQPGNIAQIAEYIVELLSDNDIATSFAAKAFEISKKYDWKERCKKIIDIFISPVSR